MKNKVIKKILVKTVFPVLSMINKVVKKHDDVILVHCSNGVLSDNALYLFKHLIDHSYNKEYKIVVSGTISDKKYQTVDNVEIISKFQAMFQYMRSKYVFYAFGKIPINPSDSQCVINLTHGTPLKSIGLTSGRSEIDEFFFSYVCCSSEYLIPYVCKSFGCDEKHVFINGEPRVDALMSQSCQSNLIVWMPTMRQSSYFGYNDSNYKELLPLLPEKDWQKFNEYLNERNLTVIAKIHPYQNRSGFTEKEFSNFKIYSSEVFEKKIGDTFSTIGKSIGLITDYSSISLNYLILNRPVCYTIPDYEEYSKTRGILLDDKDRFMPGIHAETEEDLFRFIDDLFKGKDKYRKKRLTANDLINKYRDSNNCKRLLEFAGIRIRKENIQ